MPPYGGRNPAIFRVKNRTCAGHEQNYRRTPARCCIAEAGQMVNHGRKWATAGPHTAAEGI